MSKKIIAITLILVTLSLVLFTSCYKVTTLTVANTAEITDEVSFSKDLAPIYATSCSVSGCHSSGGIKPDLSPEKLYSTLVEGNYVNVDEPEKSSVYLSLTGNGKVSMPVGTNNPSNINNLMLAWIKQGAKNN